MRRLSGIIGVFFFALPALTQTTLTPATLAFGNQAVNETSSSKAATFKNTQSVAVTISGIALSGSNPTDFVSGGNCPISPSTLGAGKSCSITVTFTPSLLGSEKATLTFTDDAANTPQAVALTGTGVAPVTLAPTTLALGTAAVGETSAAKTVTVTNHENIQLNFTSILASTGFAVAGNTCGTSIAAGTTCTVGVTFSPTAAGAATGTLTFTDDAANTPQTVALTGTGTAPATLSVGALNLGTAAVGNTSAAKTVTLTNHENMPLNFTSVVASGDFAVASNTCITSIAASATCMVGITFSPIATGTRTGALTFTDDSPNSPQTVSLTGTGVLPVTLSTSALNLGTVAVGNTSAAKTVTLTNRQNIALHFTSIAADGVANGAYTGEFKLVSNTCGTSIAAGATCTVGITFSPIAIGTRTGSLVFYDDANSSYSSQIVSLAGTGVAPVTLSVSSLNLGTVVVGDTSAAKTVTLTNREDVSLNFSSIAATGDFTVASNTCGTGLAVGDTCTVGVVFSPTAVGARTGTLSFTDDAASSPQTVNLAGTGSAAVSISPSSLTFASFTLGTTSGSKNVTLTNHLSTPLTVSAVVAAGDFAVASNACGLTVGAGLSCAITVNFKPTVVGARSGSLTISHNAFGDQSVVSLSGTGNANGLASIVVTPANPSIPAGSTQQFTAAGKFSNGSTQDVTASVTWTSSAPGVATVAAGGVAFAVAPGSATIQATSDSISGGATLTVLPQTLVSISVTPASPPILLGLTQQFSATGTYSDGSTRDVTNVVAWNSSNPGVATISATGLVTSTGGGSSTIIATLVSVSGSTILTVTTPFTPLVTSSRLPGGTATLLNDGKVLLAGYGIADLYDPATLTFSPTGDMVAYRPSLFTATLLNNGMVLFTGGNDSSAYTSAELYNPATGTFTPTGSMTAARYGHMATLLNNGQVLIASGLYGGMPIASAELYDPLTGTFTPTGSMLQSVTESTATLLNDGRVLFAPGGEGVEGVFYAGSGINIPDFSQVYDPATGTFAFSNAAPNRDSHTATLLNNGKILFAGGEQAIPGGILCEACASAELYDPTTDTSTPTGSMIIARELHTAILLNNGQVLIAGGYDAAGNYDASAELYDPTTGTFTFVGNMTIPRIRPTATRLNNGQVLINGGGNSANITELYPPTTLTPAGLVYIQVNPVSPSVSSGGTQQFVATGTFSDGSTQTLASVSWSSSNTDVAAITNDATNHGLAMAVAPGTTSITASVGSIYGFAALTVLP